MEVEKIMNKKANTLLFVLGATVFNILSTIIVFFALFLIYVKFIATTLPENVAGGAISILFVLALAASFLIYNKGLKFLMKKVDMDKYFDPIFHGKKR
jgi:K+ transporter